MMRHIEASCLTASMRNRLIQAISTLLLRGPSHSSQKHPHYSFLNIRYELVLACPKHWSLRRRLECRIQHSLLYLQSVWLGQLHKRWCSTIDDDGALGGSLREDCAQHMQYAFTCCNVLYRVPKHRLDPAIMRHQQTCDTYYNCCSPMMARCNAGTLLFDQYRRCKHGERK